MYDPCKDCKEVRPDCELCEYNELIDQYKELKKQLQKAKDMLTDEQLIKLDM
jgi:hypothetical protein